MFKQIDPSKKMETTKSNLSINISQSEAQNVPDISVTAGIRNSKLVWTKSGENKESKAIYRFFGVSESSHLDKHNISHSTSYLPSINQTKLGENENSANIIRSPDLFMANPV